MADGKKKILIVEDEQYLADMYKMRFKQDNYQVFTAGDGIPGLELALKEKPDLILLDIFMPKKDGYQTIKELKLEPQTKDIPVFMFSNTGKREEIEQAKQLGAIDCLTKANLTPAQLVEKVKAFFGSKS